MSKRDVKLLLGDMIESCNKIISYTTEIEFETFLLDNKTTDAVVRNFEIIGEVANRFPNDFKLLHPYISWEQIIGLRNRIIHEYFGIDYSIIWKIINDFIPELLKQLETILLDYGKYNNNKP